MTEFSTSMTFHLVGDDGRVYVDVRDLIAHLRGFENEQTSSLADQLVAADIKLREGQ